MAPAIRAHMKNFLECIASRERPVSDIEEGYVSTTACILANLSLQLGRSLTWDHAAGRVVRRRPGQRPAAAAVPVAVGHPDPATV